VEVVEVEVVEVEVEVVEVVVVVEVGVQSVDCPLSTQFPPSDQGFVPFCP
jgi:hypothetical protein